MTIISGGRPFYGESIGVLMLDSQFPRIPGDVGNATTFNFPVRYKVVRGASPSRVVLDRDPSLLAPFVEAAQELASEGVRAIDRFPWRRPRLPRVTVCWLSPV